LKGIQKNVRVGFEAVGREKGKEDYFVPGWGEVQSDYQPTEYGNE
jgi:hypothetical protein